MTFSPKVFVVRRWLILAASVAIIALVDPSLRIPFAALPFVGSLGILIAWKCGGVDNCPTCCSAGNPTSVTVTSGGIVNGSCTSCGSYNLSWVIPNIHGCNYEGTAGIFPCVYGIDAASAFDCSGANTTMGGTLDASGAGFAAFSATSLGAKPIDCNNFSVSPPQSVHINGTCDFSAATETVSAP